MVAWGGCSLRGDAWGLLVVVPDLVLVVWVILWKYVELYTITFAHFWMYATYWCAICFQKKIWLCFSFSFVGQVDFCWLSSLIHSLPSYKEELQRFHTGNVWRCSMQRLCLLSTFSLLFTLNVFSNNGPTFVLIHPLDPARSLEADRAERRSHNSFRLVALMKSGGKNTPGLASRSAPPRAAILNSRSVEVSLRLG